MTAHLRLRRITQTIADLAGKPWDQLRIVDLGSLEGLFALEFASHGARVLAIEGREANNVKARATSQSRGLSGAEFITDDVRNFSRERFGAFDVVLCSGILYHLPGEDGCRLIHSIADACTRLTIIDTHVGLNHDVAVTYADRSYHGVLYREHDQSDSAEVKLSRTWASLDNAASFWITQPSLLNLLRDAGFSSVFEVLRPKSFADYSDRLTFAAIKGELLRDSAMSPELQHTEEPDWPEDSNLAPFPLPHDPVNCTPRWKRIAQAVKRRVMD